MTADAHSDVVGVSLAGKTPYVVSAEENQVLCETIGVEPATDGSAHPIYYYIATQVGMGMTVADLCAVCGFDVEDGPLIGGSRVRFLRPLLTGQAYWVIGEIKGLNRKQSRKLGTIDILEYQLRLLLPDGNLVLTTTNTWILPRGEER